MNLAHLHNQTEMEKLTRLEQ